MQAREHLPITKGFHHSGGSRAGLKVVATKAEDKRTGVLGVRTLVNSRCIYVDLLYYDI
jgi:hypothetical protein